MKAPDYCDQSSSTVNKRVTSQDTQIMFRLLLSELWQKAGEAVSWWVDRQPEDLMEQVDIFGTAEKI